MIVQEKFDLREVIPALSLIVDHQVSGNLYHGFRVAIVAYYLGALAAHDKADILFYSGLLHDIGLFDTGEHVMQSYHDLDKNTKEIFLQHPFVGAKIIEKIPSMEDAPLYILQHHEFFDGSGYPLGVKGEAISTPAQILRIADSFDLFVRQRQSVTYKDIILFVVEGKGREFSPYIGNCFLKLDENMLMQIIGEEGLKRYFSELNNRIPEHGITTAQGTRETILEIFGRAIDGKHKYTNQHSLRVASYAFEIARKLGLPDDEVENIKFSGYLHDVGKLAIPRTILDKPGDLTREERELIETHVAVSYEMVRSVSCFKDFSDLVFASQEEYDGSGYPRGLKAEQIPLGARIIAVADAIDAMLSDRAYRKALPRETAIREIVDNAGSQFDPVVVKAAVALL